MAMALGGTAVVVAVVWAFPVQRWLGLSVAPGEARLALLLLGAQTLWLMPVGFLGNAYRTFGNLARSQWVGNARQLAALLLVAFVLWRGGSMTMVAAVQCVPLALVALFVVWDLGRRHPELVPGVRLARPAAMRDVAAPSLYFMMMMVAVVLSTQGCVVLVSGRLGGVAVGLFVVSRTLVNLTRQGTAMLRTVFWPDLIRLDARGDQEHLRVIHRVLVTTTTAVSVAVGAALWFEGPEVLGVWTRGAITPDPVLLRLLVVGVILQASWQASSVFSAAFNQHRTLAAAYLTSSVLGLLAAATLIDRWGTWAVPIGLIVGEAVACYVVVPCDTCARIGEAYGPFALRQWFTLAGCAAVTFLMAQGLHGVLEGPAPLRWLTMGVATTATSALAAWLLGLRAADRARLTNALSSLLGGRGARAAALRT
jgi:O-antigen/teichoic acid export membrane protein